MPLYGRMLKSLYASLAQELPTILRVDHVYREQSRADRPDWKRWLASLGAIYHLDRMIALDLPWWNVAATEAVARFLRERASARVFEYGSGASSFWLARRAQSVVTVEHDADWATKVNARLPEITNAQLIFSPCDTAGHGPDQPYVQSIANQGMFDLIVIDGRHRAACLAAATPHLKQDGIILFDDSGRERYRACIENCGLAEQHFHGRSYCVPYPDHTSILSHTAGKWISEPCLKR